LRFQFGTPKSKDEKGGKVKALIPSESIEKKIFLIRGQKVMIDSHLARLYGVTTKNLNKAVARNKERFPDGSITLEAEAPKTDFN